MRTGALSFSERERGDFRIDGDPVALHDARQAFMRGRWTWLRQVHGARVVVVDTPGQHAGEEADAAVTRTSGAVLAVHTADCVPVLFRGGGVVGAAHAGWRGLMAGVLGETLDAMEQLGARRITAHVGPHIRANCYEFGEDPLDRVAERYGDGVRSTTAAGTPALDLLATVRSALDERPEIDRVVVEGGCTACEPDRFFSHRARGDRGRHAAAITVGP
ncbi:MAG: polyphenol oxidase family protein [Acidimicrobiales bacterium]|nr:polyphenol oxidase family protein [Acidimicrobiales bacterium]